MATIREIYNVLFDFAPADMKLDWDNVGLACGHFDAEVHKILVALDPMPDVFEEAKARSCELVVTHHPLLFQGVKQVNSDTYAGNCLLYLIENSIAAMNLHTNLDCCPGGVNDVLAAKLGLEHVEILHPMGTDRQGRPTVWCAWERCRSSLLRALRPSSSRRFPAPASDSRMQENLCAKSQSAAAAAAARSMRS